VWSAHGNRQQRWGGAGVRSGKHRRLGGTATTATGDSRRSTGNAANRSAGASRVLFFVGEAAGSCCRCCRAAAPVPRVLEKQQVVVLRHATRGQPPEHGQDREAERHGNVLPSAPENVGRPCCCHREPGSRAGGGPRRTGLDTTTTAATAAGGDGRQPGREHRGGTDSKGTLAGRVFRVEPPEHSLLRSRRCSEPNEVATGRHRLALVPGYRPETGQPPSPPQTPWLELSVFAAPDSGAEG